MYPANDPDASNWLLDFKPRPPPRNSSSDSLPQKVLRASLSIDFSGKFFTVPSQCREFGPIGRLVDGLQVPFTTSSLARGNTPEVSGA